MFDKKDFDAAWYILRYPDVAESEIDPLDHYVRYGIIEGRFPNAAVELQTGFAYKVDTAWYVQRYSDLAKCEIDPVDHYIRHGITEGRLPNADAELHTGSANVVDSAWYIRRYPDVAQSGMDPIHHYVNYGFKEGRSPNWRAEHPEYWIRWFDPLWYAARYDDLGVFKDDPLKHYLQIGILEGRAPYAALDDRSYWSSVFDENWYTEKYQDVSRSGEDPLEHFISKGLTSNRKPNRKFKPQIKEVTNARMECVRSGELGENVVLFVTHCPQGVVKPHVLLHLQALKAIGLSTVLIAAGACEQMLELSGIYDNIDICYARENHGYDFAAWAHVLREMPELYQKRLVILINDSIIGPFSLKSLARAINKIENSSCDLVSLTDNFQLGWHLQSYFIAVKQSALESIAFRTFIDGIKSLETKEEVIYDYETRFTHLMTTGGLTCEALFKSRDLTNYTAYKWQELIEQGMPYIKLGILCKSVASVDIVGWRDVVREHGYETSLADRSIAIVAANSVPNKLLTDRKVAKLQRAAIVDMHKFFASKNVLDFPGSSFPDLEILIIARNQSEWLYRCLQILARVASERITITVFNNGSIDDTSYLLKQAHGVKVVETAVVVSSLQAVKCFVQRSVSGRALIMDCSSPLKQYELRRLMSYFSKIPTSMRRPQWPCFFSNEYNASIMRRLLPEINFDAFDQQLYGAVYLPDRSSQDKVFDCSSLSEFFSLLTSAGMGVENLSSYVPRKKG